jgi:uncharacterized protein with PQ loop repeat
MNYDILCYFGGVLLSVQTFPQIKRVIWDRSSSAISYEQLGMNVVGSGCIAAYGIHHHAIPLYTMMASSMLNQCVLIGLGIYYDRMGSLEDRVESDAAL